MVAVLLAENFENLRNFQNWRPVYFSVGYVRKLVFTYPKGSDPEIARSQILNIYEISNIFCKEIWKKISNWQFRENNLQIGPISENYVHFFFWAGYFWEIARIQYFAKISTFSKIWIFICPCFWTKKDIFCS